MKVEKYDEVYLDAICNLYNQIAVEDAFYKPLDIDTFKKHFNEHPEFDKDGVFLNFDGELLTGVICSFVRKIEKDDDSKPGYISLLLVRKGYEHQKIGTSLLNEALAYLKSLGKKEVIFGYLSTMNYPWYIPNTSKHDHAGAPGVLINSNLYKFLFKNRFEVVDEQDAFHLELNKFEIPEIVKNDLQKAYGEGIKIELYDKNKHKGLEEFFKEINSEPFERVIRENLKLNKPNPFAVVVKDNYIKGWTGAFYNEKSGRAHFDGIIIAPSIRGKGLGRALFAYLAEYSKTHGAQYMTFFTGRTNFARYIYQDLGFPIVESFAIMKKSL